MGNIRIFIGNFNSETLWSKGDEATIQKPDFMGVNSVIARMDELFIFLARKQDIVILRKYPDKLFLDYLKELQVVIPEIYAVKNGESTKHIGELILEDKMLMKILKNKASQCKLIGCDLEVVPYSITYFEEKIAVMIGGSISSPANLPKIYNNKEYARDLLKRYSIEMPKGHICKDIEEFQSVSFNMLTGYGKIIIKELIGSGGANVYIIQSKEQLEKFCRIYNHKENIHKKILIEKFYDVLESYNYQYLIREGTVIPYTFSRQLLLNGKIIGSYFDSTDNEKNKFIKECFISASPIAKHIAESGYNGIVGFDNIICEDGCYFPIVDINCRINLSTIFNVIHKTYFNSNYAQFYCIELKMKKLPKFYDFIDKNIIDPYDMQKKEGMVVLNSNSLSSIVTDGIIKLGRIYVGMFYNDLSKLQDRYNTLLKKINVMEGMN